MPSQRPPSPRSKSRFLRRGAFTLVEILVVIGIILLLSALSFPIFKGMQERGAQTTCASNLQQIYLAVRLYKDDEREYPASLATLLPDSEVLSNTAGATGSGTTATNFNNDEGTGYFRKTREELVCPDDDFLMSDPAVAGDPTPARSSYGDTSNDSTKAGAASSETLAKPNAAPFKNGGTHDADFYTQGDVRDWGRLAWNYYGYDDWGQGFRTEGEALSYFKSLPITPVTASSANLLRSPTKTATQYSGTATTNPDYAAVTAYVPSSGNPYFNPRGFVTDIDDTTGAVTSAPYEELREANMFKYSLSNPQAPLSTIITHCVYHRLNTAADAISFGADQLYDATTSANGANGKGARDIILRLDGTARSYDVSQWNNPNFPRTDHGSNWQISDF